MDVVKAIIAVIFALGIIAVMVLPIVVACIIALRSR